MSLRHDRGNQVGAAALLVVIGLATPGLAQTLQTLESSATFDRDGVHITAEQGGEWSWSIALDSVRRGSRTWRASPADARGGGRRVEYRRPSMVEWYVHDARGLEQGFTLATRPLSGSSAELELVLAVRGDLSAELEPGGRGVVFSSAEDRAVLSYSGLAAWDATGRDVPARIELEGSTLVICVQDGDAVYPLMIDPTIVHHSAKLVPVSPFADDEDYGIAVDIDGNTLVVGAPEDQAYGAAYVYTLSGSSWALQTKLGASDPDSLNGFARAVAISGNTIAIGAPDDDDLGTQTGSVYVFVRNGTDWTQEAKLLSADPLNWDYLGRSLDISGDTIVAGAPHDFVSVTVPGRAYVFQRSGTSWTQEARLTPSDGENGDAFGTSVSIQGDEIVVGADKDDGPAVRTGSAYLFTRTGSTWMERQKLVAADGAAGDEFGHSVSLSDDTIAIGAWKVDHIVGDLGAVYVFRRGATSWFQEAKCLPNDAPHVPSGLQFGVSVHTDGQVIAVGAPSDDTGGLARGAAYMFQRYAGVWNEQVKLLAGDALDFDFLGTSVAVSGQWVLAGAPEYSFSPNKPGKAYVFSIAAVPETYCSGKLNSVGCTPAISTSGSASTTIPSPFMLAAEYTIEGNPGLLLYGFTKANFGFHGGTLCVNGGIRRLLPPLFAVGGAPAPCSGTLTRDFNQRIQSGVDPMLTSGQTVTAQWRQRDTSDPSGFGGSLTNAVSFVIDP